MIRRRLVPFALVVTVLLAVVAIAAHGEPLGSGGGRGSGVPMTFWDYVFTTVLIVMVFTMVIGAAALVLFRRDPGERKTFHRRTFRALATLFIVALLVVVIGRHLDLNRLLHRHGSTPATAPLGGTGKNGKLAHVAPRHVQFRWEELVIVLGLLVVLGAIAARSRRRLVPTTDRVAPEALAAALDESLDDLRFDADLRRAIIASYARMERALAAAGLARQPAEAPLEYLERALLSLDASADAVRRLTDLFHWARFSHHEPDPSMRDEAVNALETVRDELRASEPVAW